MGWSGVDESGAAPSAVFGDELDSAIVRFAKEAAGLGDGEAADAVVRVAGLRSMLEAVEIAVVGHLDESRAFVDEGFRNPSGFLRQECRVPKGVAGRRVGLSRKLRDMPATADTFDAGLIELSHVDRLAQCNSRERAQAFAEAEVTLVAAACGLSFADFVIVVERFEFFVDPDPDDTEADRDSRRRVSSSKMFNSMGKIDAVLDPTRWAIFDTVLRQIERELFDADWAVATEEHGDDRALSMLSRTMLQRRADALVEMARRAAAAAPDGRRPKPSVVVHVDYETFVNELKRRTGCSPPSGTPGPKGTDAGVCELQDGTQISSGRALELAIESHVRRMVFDRDGHVLAFGRRRRFFTGGLREMIEARDRYCQGPGCDVPDWGCDVDHLIDWQHQGTTQGANGGLKCRWHNHHKPQYDITTCAVTGISRWRKCA
jgi:hypothetical protein